eukprot:2705423-Rhodomonas_salina.2
MNSTAHATCAPVMSVTHNLRARQKSVLKRCGLRVSPREICAQTLWFKGDGLRVRVRDRKEGYGLGVEECGLGAECCGLGGRRGEGEGFRS